MDTNILAITSIAIPALAGFTFVASVTPGPNNLMLAASGLNFGIRKSLPHMLGVELGFLFMLFLVCLGLGNIFLYYPIIQTVLTYAGCVYLLYLAYRIATASGIGKLQGVKTPLSFIEASLFQWINPKAWIMAITFSSAYGLQSENLAADTAATILVVGVCGAPCILIWTGFGAGLRRWMQDEKRLRMINYFMAALLVATIPLMLSN